jgi:TP901 family phage tail tape measure protein
MAETIERLIQLVFDATDRTGPALKSLGQGVDDLGNRIESLSAPIVSLTQNLLALEGAGAAAATALIGFAVKAAGQFDAGIREIATLVNGGAEEVANLKQQILNLAPSASSFETVTKAVYSAVSATGDLQGSLAAMHTAEQLALAGRAELSDSTLLLVSSINAFGASMQDAQRFADVFFTAVQQGQTTLPEFAASFGQLAPIAKAAGLSLEETVAAVTTLTKSGVGTSEAMSGIKAALSAIVKPTGEAAKAAREMGIGFDQSALAGKGLQGFLDALSQATGGNVTKMGQLVGSVEGLNAMLLLTANQGETFTTVLGAMQNSTGNVAKAAELMGQSVATHTQSMVNAVTAALVTLGDPLLTPFTDVEDAIANIFTAIRQAADSGAFDPLLQYITENLNEVRDTVNAVATALPQAFADLDWSGLLQELRDLREAVGSIFPADLNLGSAEGLRQVLQGIVNVGAQLIAWTTSLVEAFAPVIRAVIELGTEASTTDHTFASLLGKVSAYGTLLNAATPALTLAADGMQLLASGMLLASTRGTTLATIMAGLISGPVGWIALGAGAAIAADQIFGLGQKLTESDTQLHTWAASLREWTLAQVGVQQSTEDVTTSMGALVGGLLGAIEAEQQASDQTQANIAEFADWAQTAEDLGMTFTRLADGTLEMTAKTEEARGAQEKFTESTAELTERLEPLAALLGGTAEAMERAAQLDSSGYVAVGDAVSLTAEKMTDLSNASSTATTSLEDLSTRTDLTIQEQQDLALKLEEVNLKWAELESQERTLVFQLEADMAIAQIEAGAQTVQAAFESITTSIQSTTESFSTLVGAFVQLEGRAGQGTIKDLMQEQLKLQKDALAQQKELIRAQIDYLNAINERLGSGQAMITVTTDGLEPALTNLMWEVLRKIQIEASAQGQQFLLGLPAAA